MIESQRTPLVQSSRGHMLLAAFFLGEISVILADACQSKIGAAHVNHGMISGLMEQIGICILV